MDRLPEPPWRPTREHIASSSGRTIPDVLEPGLDLVFCGKDVLLPRYGLGVTNLVARATAGAAELGAVELVEGGRLLVKKLRRFRARAVAVVGVGAYRTAFDRRRAVVGLQDEDLGGVPVWVLPNPSGRGAHYRPAEFVEAFAQLRRFVERRIRDSSAAGSATPSRTSSRSSSSAPSRRTRRTSRSPR